ncbi:glycosyl hydrolase [Pedobacter jamesrossensis]|uniref:Glycosyl hydrolase n=1 Tax=Pedobacter jamesrossensis TaxID=1908238 RepID=A0ABV8NPP6_9SPHI
MFLNLLMPVSTTLAQTKQAKLVSLDAFRKGFKVPQDSLKPYVYWYWVSDNISKIGITKDLEAMAKVGIGEAFIGNIGLSTVPYGKVKVLSKEWWELTKFAITEGQRLGVDIGIFNSPGWSQSGGPWVKPTEAMRYLVSTEVSVAGGKNIKMKLPAAQQGFQDMAVIAYPVSSIPEQTVADFKPSLKFSTNIINGNYLIDKNLKTAIAFTPEAKKNGLTIDFNLEQSFTARSITIHPDTVQLSAQVEVQALINGTYKSVRKFLMDRSNNMITVGPNVYGEICIALPVTSATSFRVLFSELSNPQGQQKVGGIKEIVLSNHPKLERYIEKQMGKMLQVPTLSWNEYLWENQLDDGSNNMRVSAGSVINISRFLDHNGVLNWNAPKGKWIIKRVGLVPTGTKNAPASPEATGFEVDKMNRVALEKHFNAYLGKFLKELPAEKRKSFKHVVLDSYEVGPQNWTEGLAEDFKKKYGYDPIVWLPVLSGTIVNSPQQSDRFLWDLRRLIADRIAYDYAGGLRDISQKNGLKVWSENYGHWGFPSEFLLYGGQGGEIAGEFWVEGTLGNVECRAASSAAHIYGNNRVFAESYTAGGLPYQRYPGYLKKRGDWSFTEGINHVLLHVYIHQPYEDKDPGMNAWFGTEFNRKNTWFEQSKTWIDYQRRSMFMLQQGKPVNDICYFIGEDAPKLAGGRDPEIPAGYSYDYINADVILNKMTVKDGKLTLPDGMSYSMMVLPPLTTMTPELLQKIKELVIGGGIILGPKPSKSPSLRNYPNADQKVRTLADELWGDTNRKDQTTNALGKGFVLNGINLDRALAQFQIYPDIVIPNGKPLLFTHRKTAKEEIYFITNQSDDRQEATITFRVKGKHPELWDATTGTTRKLPQFNSTSTGTALSLKFEPAESYFIVFVADDDKSTATENFPEAIIEQEITTPWSVKFQANRRGPSAEVEFATLQDWSKHPDEKIRYFSGTATYTNTFIGKAPLSGERIFLDLGDVKNMAMVKINGKTVGGLWTAPWHIDITKFVSNGKNSVEIEVVNLWVNRMIGDSKLSEKDRPTWLANNYFNPTDPLTPSGLLGPVSIKLIKY